MKPFLAEPEPDFDTAPMIAFCVDLIARDADYAEFDQRVMAAAADLMPPPPTESLNDDPDLQRRLWHCFSRSLWNATPHPSHRYAIAPLPKAERNSPCHCGSGQKYKRCCAEIDRDVPMLNLNLLPSLLEAMPRKRWPELVGSRVDIERVADTVRQWSVEGRSADILRLLEPWFVSDGAFNARREELLDCLLDAYTNLHKPRKKDALLKRALACGDAQIRATAMYRRVCMAADAGDYPLAWRLFGEAQRMLPGSPSLSHLEVTILMSEGRKDEAAERARFWIAHLRRQRDPGLDGIIAFLQNVIEHGSEAILDVASRSDQLLQEFLQSWREAPPIACLYKLEPDATSAGALIPKPRLAAALAQWYEACPPLGYSPVDEDLRDLAITTIQGWLPLLQQYPMLWNAFEVLDAVVNAAQSFPYAGMFDAVGLPMLERGEQLLREVLRFNAAEGLLLEWGWMENRPALSLLGSRIANDAQAAATPQSVARLEWLVCTLNPTDNQGFRNVLVRRYLETDRLDDALALIARYPDDFAAMQYNRALVFFASGDTAAALSALDDTLGNYPKPAAWLLKSNPKPPRQEGPGVLVGGDEEAWMYRDEFLPLWKKFGALDWLRKSVTAHKKNPRKVS